MIEAHMKVIDQRHLLDVSLCIFGDEKAYGKRFEVVGLLAGIVWLDVEFV